jgi:hypothetical protein
MHPYKLGCTNCTLFNFALASSKALVPHVGGVLKRHLPMCLTMAD